MRLAGRPLPELVAALARQGVTVEKVDDTSGNIIIRLPGYLGLPLLVNEQGMAGFFWMRKDISDTEFCLVRRREALSGAQEFLCDLFGFEAVDGVESGLRKNGWRPYWRDSWSDKDEVVRVTLLKGPPKVVGEIKGREATIQEPKSDKKIPEFTRRLAERRLEELQNIVDEIHLRRENAECRPIEAYLQPLPRELVRLSTKEKPVQEKNTWATHFSRSGQTISGTPRFFMSGSHYYLKEMDGYSGGHRTLDAVLALCGTFGFESETSGSSSPGNASAYEFDVSFLDGGIHVEGGNYFCGPRGAYLFGFRSLRFILWHLGCKQPRKFRDEKKVPTADELEAIGMSPFPAPRAVPNK